MQYRAEVDGLRAMAVVPVVLFHAGVPWLPGGYAGVDVFFVISGYLISTILWQEVSEGRFSLSGFYERRARRILPALFVVLCACLVVAWLVLLPFDLRAFAQSLVAVASFGANVYFWKTSDYFNTDAHLKPLLHTWSLSVEEQFYVLFPLLLIWGRRWAARQWLWVLGGTALASLVWAQWCVLKYPSAAFYLLPARTWELLLGAIAALVGASGWIARWSLAARQSGAGVGAVMLGLSMTCLDEHAQFPGAAALLPTVGAVLLILCARPDTWVGQWLSWRPIVMVGLLSYSLYLWHQPVLAFARYVSTNEPNPAVMAGLVLLSLVLAWVSWRWVEAPFRRGRNMSRRLVFGMSGVGLAAFASLGAVGHVAQGFPDRLPPQAKLSPEFAMARADNGWCFYSVDNLTSLAVGEAGTLCWLGSKQSSRKWLLFGDSYAGQYEPMLDEVGRQLGVAVHALTTNWCHPSAGRDFAAVMAGRSYEQCMYNRQYLQAHVGDYEVVVIAGQWGALDKRGQLKGVEDLVRRLAPHVKQVIILPSPRQFDRNALALYQMRTWHGQDFNVASIRTGNDVAARRAAERLQASLGKLPNVLLLPRESLFNVAGKASDLTDEGLPYSLEGWHISIYGARKAAATFMHSVYYERLSAMVASAGP